MRGIPRLVERFREARPGYYRVDRVAPWLLIGPALDDDDYRSLIEVEGVTHIVDLREEAVDDPALMQLLGVYWRQFAIPDRGAPTVELLDALVDWLDEHPARDEKLYLHCQAGLGRTPTMAIALLLRHEIPLRDAHALVLEARPEASPTPAQLAWIESLAPIEA